MIVNYDTEKLKNTLKDFSNVTGVNIQLIKEDFTSFRFDLMKNDFCLSIQSCDAGKEACKVCDYALLEKCKKSKQAQMHTCHAGLVDIAVPILHDDSILGYIILGQMKNKTDFEEIRNKIKDYCVDISKMEEYYNSLMFFDYDRIESVSKIAIMLTKYIMLEHMLKPGGNRNVDKVTAFVDNNLDKDLTVEYITENVHISKSVIYKDFRTCFDCTLKEYVNKKRVEKAVKLLKETDLSIDEISADVGFSSAAYFTSVFKKEKGISPFKFRKKSKS